MPDPIQNVHRLRALFELSLIDAPEETIYNKLTVLASEVIGTPVSLVSMVASDYQFFKSQVGLPDPYSSTRRTPMSHSFCQHVVRENKPLIVNDAREHDLVKRNLAIRDLNVIGYLGIPLTMKDGQSLGSFCVIDNEPRDWTDNEIEIMSELADIITIEFDTRAAVLRKQVNKAELGDLQERIIAFSDAINTSDSKSNILSNIREQRRAYNI